MRRKMFVFIVGEDSNEKFSVIDHLTDPKNNFCVRGVYLKDAMVIKPDRLLINPQNINQALDTLLSQIRMWTRSNSEVLIIDNLTISAEFKDRVLYLAQDFERVYKDMVDVFMVGIRIGHPSMQGIDKPTVTVYDKNKFKFLIDVPRLSDNIDEMCQQLIDVYTKFSERYIKNSFWESPKE